MAVTGGQRGQRTSTGGTRRSLARSRWDIISRNSTQIRKLLVSLQQVINLSELRIKRASWGTLAHLLLFPLSKQPLNKSILGLERPEFWNRIVSRSDWLLLDFDGSLKGVPGWARGDKERAETAAVEAYVAGDDGVAGAALGVAVEVGVDGERFGGDVSVGCHFWRIWRGLLDL